MPFIYWIRTNVSSLFQMKCSKPTELIPLNVGGECWIAVSTFYIYYTDKMAGRTGVEPVSLEWQSSILAAERTTRKMLDTYSMFFSLNI